MEGHSYTILNTKKKDGFYFIELRNPWGHTGRKYVEDSDSQNGYRKEQKYEGTFLIELNDFIATFVSYSVNG